MNPTWYICVKIDAETKKVLGAEIFSERSPTCMANIRYALATDLEFSSYEEAVKYLAQPMFEWIGKLYRTKDGDRFYRGKRK